MNRSTTDENSSDCYVTKIKSYFKFSFKIEALEMLTLVVDLLWLSHTYVVIVYS